jgi:hypothetical protein
MLKVDFRNRSATRKGAKRFDCGVDDDGVGGNWGFQRTAKV